VSQQPIANPKHERFAHEYVVDNNATQAAISAGYSSLTAGQIGCTLLKKVDIAARTAWLQEQCLQRVGISADEILRRWWETATADVNELVKHKIGPCRYCYGFDGEYQWRTSREFRDTQTAYLARNKRDNSPDDENAPSDVGGYGYNTTLQPRSGCGECDGLGVAYVVFTDTERLSEQGKLLYAGVKITAGGKEMLLADREKAMEHIARRFGLTKAVMEASVSSFVSMLEHIWTNGSTSPIAAFVTDEETEA
jgi:phage terminase small subunit